MQKNVFIGVAWPYVNGNPHIGHLAGYLLPADICARFHRLQGNNVLMASGSDCFGTPITVQADKEGVTPKDIVEKYHNRNVKLFKDTLNLTYDIYTKTDTENHIKTTQEIFLKLLAEGYIFVDTSEQYYSESQNKFLPDRYVVGECPFCGFEDSRSDQCDNCGKLISHGELKNPRASLNDEPVELKESEHYFVDWPKLQPKLEEYVDRVGGNWKEWVRNETKGWLKEGLKPREITRDLDWGVPLPVDRIPEDKQIKDIENKRIYVWFDAVIGYLSASKEWADSGKGNWEDFWIDNDNEIKMYNFMGKDNLVFHTLFWPGQLMGYDKDLHLPDLVSINQFLNFGGQQFSKSRGVVIDSDEIVNKYGNDAVRFYLTLIMPENRDSSFTWEDFEEKVNGILVANIGNFIHRTLSIGQGTGLGIIEEKDINDDVLESVRKAFELSRTYLDSCQYKNYLDELISLSSFGNKLFNDIKPWELKKENPEQFKKEIAQFYFIVLALGILSQPLLFEGSTKLFEQLEVQEPNKWDKDAVKQVLTLLNSLNNDNKPKALFGKIEV